MTDSAVGPAVPKVFPQIKLINWFDIRKGEGEAEERLFTQMHRYMT